MAIQRLSHIGICVSELERSVRFYRDLLGFRERSQLGFSGDPASTLLQIEGLELRVVYLERDGTCIELLHYPTPGHVGDSVPRPMNRLGLTHLSLRVDDLETLLKQLADAGAQVLKQSRIETQGVSAIFVTDPDGTRIELVQAPGDPAALPGE